MNKSLVLAILSGTLLLLLLPGCRQQETAAPDTGVVEANQAYLAHFGSPPHETRGRAFARVGYLPLRDHPGRVRAIPLFLFSERDQDQLSQILERLTGGDLILPPDAELYSPFPADLEVGVSPPENGTLSLRLTTRESWPAADLRAAGMALTETAAQFPDIEKVRILLNDEPFPQMTEAGFTHDPKRLLEVGRPTLVTMVGMWEKGDESLNEIMVEFDRPVTVNSIDLRDEAGNRVDGDYFTSAFRMAVVIHPTAPDNYRDGTMLRAEWDIVDTLGRANQGATSLPLRRVER